MFIKSCILKISRAEVNFIRGNTVSVYLKIKFYWLFLSSCLYLEGSRYPFSSGSQWYAKIELDLPSFTIIISKHHFKRLKYNLIAYLWKQKQKGILLSRILLSDTSSFLEKVLEWQRISFELQSEVFDENQNLSNI